MRSSWKVPFFNDALAFRLKKSVNSATRETALKIKHRIWWIDSSMVSRFFGVFNGKHFKKLSIEPQMVGHRMGEFVTTKRMVHHYRKKRQKALEKKKKEELKKAGKSKVMNLAKIAEMRKKRKSRK